MKSIKSALLFLVCLVMISSTKAQTRDENVAEPVVFTINGKQKVYLGEFERQFLKNLNLNEKKVTSKDIDDYLKLYVKFKLKIQDASDAGKDTAAAYKQELAMYREQLSRNYLYDRAVTQGLIEEAYLRLQSEI
jgi:peptidyl-prolyl cis-trans isomerase SurA